MQTLIQPNPNNSDENTTDFIHDFSASVSKIEFIDALSKKSNNRYKCLKITLTNNYVFRIFLDRAELFMVESLLEKDNKLI